MSKMSTESARIALNGPTMGTRWSALFFAEPDFNPAPILAALQAAVEEVDGQMSTWNAGSDLMRLNAAPVGEWVAVPAQLAAVLRLGLEIGRASGGAFDIGMGDAVTAWGFGPDTATSEAIRAAMGACRQPAHEVLEIDAARVRKYAPIALDLNGIAKGYGVDRLAETLRDYGITDALVGIDGEMRAMGLRPDGAAWAIAVEAPDTARRTPHSILALQDAAVATSLPPLGRGAGTSSVAHHGPGTRRAADRLAGLRHRGGPHLCRGRCLGDRAHGARPRSGRGTRNRTRTRRPVSPTG